MILDSSKTGLLPVSRRRFFLRPARPPKLEFQECIHPAPIALKPFSTLINPFRKGCSIFCNHPTVDADLKMIIKRSKRKKENIEREDYGVDKKALADRVGDVLEEMMLCRRRTSYDRSSSSADESTPPHRTHLVLDLRRTTSQDTLSVHTGDRGTSDFQSSNISPALSPLPSQARANINNKSMKTLPINQQTNLEVEKEGQMTETDDDTELQKRRGKLKKKKKKAVAPTNEKSGKEVIGPVEPGETQISTCQDSADVISWQGSPTSSPQPPPDNSEHLKPRLLEVMSDLFDHMTLRHLRRSLTEQQVAGEYRRIWRKVLLEALAASDKKPEEELSKVEEECGLYPTHPESWLPYPRIFKYSSARFDLPIDKKRLKTLSSIDYLRNYVIVEKEHRLLYCHIFDKYKVVPNDGNDQYMQAQDLIIAVGDVMGRCLTDEEETKLKSLLNWQDELEINLRAWIGICALAERIFGLAFSTGENPDLGQRQILEEIDFEGFNAKLRKLNLDKQLHALLKAIQVVPRYRQ